MGHFAGRTIAGVGVAHVVKGHGADVADSRRVIEHVPTHAPNQWYAPFGAADPAEASLTLGEIVATQAVGPAEGEIFAVIGKAAAAIDTEGPQSLGQPAEAVGHAFHKRELPIE